MELTLPVTAAALLIGHSAGPFLLGRGYDAAWSGPSIPMPGYWHGRSLPRLSTALENVLNAVGPTGAITWLSMGIVAGNLIGSTLFVHGIGSWNGLGVAGAAWATTGVNTAAAASLLGRALRSGFGRFELLRLADVLRMTVEIVRLGWAPGAQQALEASSSSSFFTCSASGPPFDSPPGHWCSP